MSEDQNKLQVRAAHPRHYSTSTIRPIRTASTPTTKGVHGGKPSTVIEALDLCPKPREDISSALASLRVHVLSYLSDLEARLTLLHFQSQSQTNEFNITRPTSPDTFFISSSDEDEGSQDQQLARRRDFSPNRSSGSASDDEDRDDIVLCSDDVATFIKQGFELLQAIRADVCSYLPEMEFDFDFAFDTHSDSLRSRLAGTTHQLADRFPDFPPLTDLKSSLPTMTMPSLSMDDLKSHLHLPAGVNDPMSYVPQLKAHLASLQEHLHERLPSTTHTLYAFPRPSQLSPPKAVMDILTDLLEEDTEEAIQADIQKEKLDVETMHGQILRGLEKSENGSCLIRFGDLPRKWQNNEFVQFGYR